MQRRIHCQHKKNQQSLIYQYVPRFRQSNKRNLNDLNFVQRSKINNHKQRSKSASRLSTRIRPKNECSSSATATATTTTATTTTSINVLNNAQPFECLAHATATSPANLSMIVKQSYKPLHAKSTQFNKNTIAVTKGTQAIYFI